MTHPRRGYERAMRSQDRAVIRAYDDGPLLVRGDFEIQTGDGEVIDANRATVALCRCGKSAIKPFCDGTHKAIGFRAGVGRDSTAPRSTTGDA